MYFSRGQFLCQMVQYATKNVIASMRIIVSVLGKLIFVATMMLSAPITTVPSNSIRDANILRNKFVRFIFYLLLFSGIRSNLGTLYAIYLNTEFQQC